NYLEREMRDTRGGFYSSQDADSDGHEGAFFVWSGQEVRYLLGRHSYFDALQDYWGLIQRPNFDGQNILWTPLGLSEAAQRAGIDVDQFEDAVIKSRKLLFHAREGRVRPTTDTKILASWNGLIINSLAQAGRWLGNKHYVDLAKDAGQFVLEHMQLDG